jgi:SAM-dependent methyltransferase
VAAGVDPFVEYDKVAARFQKWRSGRPGALDRWGQAVQPFLPGRSVTVGDIGAGTGAFSRAWPSWADAAVVGIEPSAAMLASARSAGVPPRCLFMRGVAEALPVGSGTLDIAWISTAFHHFSDRQRAAYELRRALVDDGVVMIRGLLPDRAGEGWWSVFPGYERAMLRFPSLDELEGVFNAAGFALAGSTDVVEGESSYGEQADWVDAMRDADSVLTALSDAEIEAGTATMRKRFSSTIAHELSLVVFK